MRLFLTASVTIIQFVVPEVSKIQKKKDDIFEFILLVVIVFKATKDPNKYDPLSPRKILAIGKLKRRNEIKTISCAERKNAKSSWLLFKFINNKTELIIIKLIVKRPLKPSIKFDPLTIKRKHSNTKRIEKMSFLSHEFKKFKSIEVILIEK